MASGHSIGVSRRDEYAEATRRASVAAARQLFSERGYFATKVDDIAALACVAPATVYAASGGKQGLLRTLTEIWTTAPIITITLGSVNKLDDPVVILRLVGATTRTLREELTYERAGRWLYDVTHLALLRSPVPASQCEGHIGQAEIGSANMASPPQ